MGAREKYRAARRLARDLKWSGRWLETPVRIADGYPGQWVQADGQVVGFRGFVEGCMWGADALELRT